MSSSRFVDYRLRKNKSIERSIIFSGLRQLKGALGLDYVYVGLGSVWFVDFELAHRILGVTDMVSIENDPVIATRAEFNAPFRTISVRRGRSNDVIPDELLVDDELGCRPWILWLDYDGLVDDDSLGELEARVLDLPTNSVLLATFNAAPHKYGQLSQRAEAMVELLGDSFPSERFSSNKDYGREDTFPDALADALLSRLRKVAVDAARPGGFVDCFRFRYQDGTPMVTVGGVLPSLGAVSTVRSLVLGDEWGCRRQDALVVPPLTQREIAALRKLMPATAISRSDVSALGFDLEEQDIRAFVDNYLQYPMFAQVYE